MIGRHLRRLVRRMLGIHNVMKCHRKKLDDGMGSKKIN